jgi:hypothetical protein
MKNGFDEIKENNCFGEYNDFDRIQRECYTCGSLNMCKQISLGSHGCGSKVKWEALESQIKATCPVCNFSSGWCNTPQEAMLRLNRLRKRVTMVMMEPLGRMHEFNVETTVDGERFIVMSSGIVYIEMCVRFTNFAYYKYSDGFTSSSPGRQIRGHNVAPIKVYFEDYTLKKEFTNV